MANNPEIDLGIPVAKLIKFDKPLLRNLAQAKRQMNLPSISATVRILLRQALEARHDRPE